MASSIIDSDLKKSKPPTAYAASLVDTSNLNVHWKLFNECMSSGKDAALVERMAHVLMACGRLKNAATVGALVPLVQRLPAGGEELAAQLTAQVQKLEDAMAKMAATKKHVDNAEFVEVAKAAQGLWEEACAGELQALQAVVKDISEEDLVAAAADIETAKLNADLSTGAKLQLEAAAGAGEAAASPEAMEGAEGLLEGEEEGEGGLKGPH